MSSICISILNAVKKTVFVFVFSLHKVYVENFVYRYNNLCIAVLIHLKCQFSCYKIILLYLRHCKLCKLYIIYSASLVFLQLTLLIMRQTSAISIYLLKAIIYSEPIKEVCKYLFFFFCFSTEHTKYY